MGSKCDKALKHPRVKMLGACGVQQPGVGSSSLPGEAGCLLQKKQEPCLGV